MACTLLTFCRRAFWANQSTITKCCSAYSTKAQQKKKIPKETIHVAYEDAKEIVLDFFNKCDQVTLKKLINLKPFQFEQHDFSYLHSRTIWLADRFPNIDDFITTYNLTPKNVENMALSILELKGREKGSFGMNAIQPNFVRKGKQIIDKVVVLDVFRKNVSWCVRSTADHSVQDLGFEVLDIPDNFDHTKYHPKISRFLQNLPESEVYLLHSVSKRNRGRQLTYFALQQAIVETVIITLLNNQHSNANGNMINLSTNNDKSVEPSISENRITWSNRVYLWDMLAMKDFYDINFKGDQLPTSSIIKNLYQERQDIIHYWKMDANDVKDLFYKDGSEQLSLCVLMSDAFCRCLKKTDENFPYAYS